jgi:hypothetical protein
MGRIYWESRPEVNVTTKWGTCLDVKGELCAHDPFKLDNGDATINAGVDKPSTLCQDLIIRL